MKIKCARVFLNTNLQNSHHGLTAMTGDMQRGELILFVNTGLSAYKCLVDDHLVVHYKSAAGKLTINDIASLPEIFGGERMIIARDVMSQLIETFKVKLKKVG